MMPQDDDEAAAPQCVELRIPWITYLQLAIALLVAGATYLLWPLLLLVFLALFLAVTLDAFVSWLDAKGMNHRASLFIVSGGLLTALSLGVALIFPALIEQAATFGKNFPALRDQLLGQLPEAWGVRRNVGSMMTGEDWTQAGDWLGHFMSAGGVALGGLSQTLLLIVLALYLLIDGRKTYEWFLAFFSPLKRAKLRITTEEVSKVIFGYVSGQVITSVLVFVFSFVVLSLLNVPAALTLALLAGILDILPILGFIFSTVPAVLLALSVSPQTAFVVLGLYLLFHALETYFIIPKVYGKSLRLSTLTVLVGLLAGTLLAGIPGALAALPIIASYEAIERIWLKPFLRDGVSEKHEMQKDEVFGDKG